MQCTEFREHLFDLMAGERVAPEVKAHFSACPDCSLELASMSKTMDLLDEWKAPEDTSPYFMTRLRARVREEAAKEAPSGWLTWFRKPAIAISMAVLFLVSLTLINSPEGPPPPQKVTVSATNDVQYLDKNSDVLQNLELLDDLSDNSSTANP